MFSIMKKHYGLIIISLILTVAICGCVITTENEAYSYETDIPLMAKCEDFTRDKLISVNAQDQSINDYPSYLNSRFQLDNLRYNVKNIEDEWILHIVPIELFKQKREVFYMGYSYGFYFDYDANADVYLIYLMENEYNYENGILSREIRPIYYEQYVFNESTQKVSLVYMDYYQLDIHYYHYRKHSRYEKLYLKDVNFSGSLYNENHKNIGETGYDPYEDKGGFFVQSQYKFKGLSTQSGKFDFAGAMLKMGIGYIPIGALKVGDVMNAVTALAEFTKHISNSVDAFNGTVSNEELYDFIEYMGMNRDDHISNYGNPLKHSATEFKTQNNANAVLLGINNGCYARNEYLINFYDQGERWNTRYVGDVTLDIVKVNGSRVTEIAKGISHTNNSGYTLDVGEKTQVMDYEIYQLYTLSNAKHNIAFYAPQKGIYTVKTKGSVNNTILSKIGTVTAEGNNAVLVVELDILNVFEFAILSKENIGSANIEMEIRFTPEEINKGESKTMEIAPHVMEFYRFDATGKNGAFDFIIDAPSEIELRLYHNNIRNVIYNISGANIHGSSLCIDGNYFIGVRNKTNSFITADVGIENTKTITPQESMEINVYNQLILELTAPYSSSVRIISNSTDRIKLSLYDDQSNLLDSPDSDEPILESIDKGKKYYVLIRNYTKLVSNVEISVEWNAYELALGDNEVHDLKADKMVMYENSDIEAPFSIATDASFKVVDAQFNTVSSDAEGTFTFFPFERYYIILLQDSDSGIINFDIDCTESLSGTYSSKGVKFIKYIPNRTSVYVVNGASNYQWYDDYLRPESVYLYKGYTYYLKLNGAPMQNYEVSINIKRNELPINRVTTITPGSYYFKIEEAAEYSVRTNVTNNHSSSLSIRDENGVILVNELGIACDNITTDKLAYQIYLPIGLYYIDINVIGSRPEVSLQINSK